MKSISKIVLLIIVVFFSISKSRAQADQYHFEAGINIGTLLYQGDLIENPFGSFKGAKPMVNLWIAKPFNPYFSWRANLTIGSLSADESRFANPSWKRSRNFAFSTPLTELTGMVQFNPYGDNGKTSYHTLTPYLMIGAGAAFLNIKRDWSRVDSVSGVKSAIQGGITRDSLQALPRVLPVIPIGAGLRWMVTPTIAVNAEAAMRFAFTDYIDGFSYSANPKRKDTYYGISLGISFLFGGSGLRCPVVPKE
jgi:OOP family OmpA-OmpF porin